MPRITEIYANIVDEGDDSNLEWSERVRLLTTPFLPIKVKAMSLTRPTSPEQISYAAVAPPMLAAPPPYFAFAFWP